MTDVQMSMIGRIALSSLLLGLAAGLLVTTQTYAGSEDPVVEIEGGGTFVGDDVTVDLVASGIVSPGLGAWTLDITFDPGLVTVSECLP